MIPLPRKAKDAAEHIIGVRGKKLVKYALLRAQMAAGQEPFTAGGSMDRKLLDYLPPQGFFVEAGANDGIEQSNTFYLEVRRGWAGILIEPVPQLAALARRFRHAKVYQAALGAPEDSGRTIELSFRDLGTRQNAEKPPRKWAGLLGRNPSVISATIRTLSDIIAEEGNPVLDFLSLDVEGYELEVLRGLDLNRHAPSFILIETSKLSQVDAALGDRYHRAAQLGGRDYLFERL